MSEKNGRFEQGKWISYVAEVHAWHYQTEYIRRYTNMQEAYDDAFYGRQGDDEYIEKIVVHEGNHIEEFPWCIDDPDGKSEKRFLERYGVIEPTEEDDETE